LATVNVGQFKVWCEKRRHQFTSRIGAFAERCNLALPIENYVLLCDSREFDKIDARAVSKPVRFADGHTNFVDA
jgi:hypothetical protein